MAKTSSLKRAQRLEEHATFNRATVASLLANGATEDYVKELSDKADAQEAQGKQLRERAARGKT
jgi:hypothetical protein